MLRQRFEEGDTWHKRTKIHNPQNRKIRKAQKITTESCIEVSGKLNYRATRLFSKVNKSICPENKASNSRGTSGSCMQQIILKREPL